MSVESSRKAPTVLDVLDNVLGYGWPSLDATKLSDTKVTDVFHSVNEFYRHWALAVDPEELQVLSGYQESAFGGAVDPQKLFSKLLYFDRVLLEDPLAAALTINTDPFAAMRHGAARIRDPETSFDLLRFILDAHLDQLAAMRPLIDAGFICLVPAAAMLSGHIKNQEEPFAQLVELACEDPAFIAVAETVFPDPDTKTKKAIEKFALGAQESLGLLSRSPAHLYIASLLNTATLVAARDFHGLYVPDNLKAWMLYLIYFQLIEEEVSGSQELHLMVADSLLEAEIPDFDGLTPSTVIKVRENDEYFAAWRSDLRSAVGGVKSMPGSQDFREEASLLLNDLIHPRAEVIRRKTRASNVLKSAAKEPVMALTVGAAVATGGLTGLPLSSSLASSGVAALGTWGLKLLFSDQPEGTNAIIAKLIGR